MNIRTRSGRTITSAAVTNGSALNIEMLITPIGCKEYESYAAYSPKIQELIRIEAEKKLAGR